MNLITERLIEEAHRDIGVCEVARNSGPQIDEWLRRVKSEPGKPWCAAWAWCKLDDAIKAVGFTNYLPPTASVHRLFELAHQHHAWWSQPGPGYIFGIDHGAGTGHCGIVLDVRNDVLATVEGNTNRKGEREGKWVLVRTRAPAECTLGSEHAPGRADVLGSAAGRWIAGCPWWICQWWRPQIHTTSNQCSLEYPR